MNTTDPRKPITSSIMMNALSDSLAEYKVEYKIMFWLICETDIPYSMLYNRKVSDLKGKKEISYQGYRGQTVFTEPIPEHVRSMLDEFLADKDASEYAFVGSRSGKPINIETFRLALRRSSMLLGYDSPGINLSTLQKTFILNAFYKDPQKAYAHSSCRYPKELYSFLGISPSDGSISIPGTREDFLTLPLYKESNEAYRTATDSIAAALKDPDSRDDGFFYESATFLKKVNDAANTFIEKTSADTKG